VPGGRGPPGSGAGRRPAPRDPVGGEHRLVEPLQLRPGIDAELVGDHLPGPAIGRQRLGTAPGRVERLDEEAPQPLLKRLIGKEPAQLGHELGVPTAAEVCLDPQLERGQP